MSYVPMFPAPKWTAFFVGVLPFAVMFDDELYKAEDLGNGSE